MSLQLSLHMWKTFILILGTYLTSCAQKESKPKNSVSTEIIDDNRPQRKKGNSVSELNEYRVAEVRLLSDSPNIIQLGEPGREGTFRLDETDNKSKDNGGTILVNSKGKRYKRVFDNEINVRWFGAKADGKTDDIVAIQNAINYAKTLFSTSGGTYRATIIFPAGFYYISNPIDITNSNGIWLKGSSGRYINTGFIGDTGGVILDFSGSTMSGCEGFTFLSMNGNAKRSTVGVLFALTDKGGLNGSVRNCYFKLEDNAGANGGFGTIGILNIRAEEFSAADCVISANTPIILSNSYDLSNTGVTTKIFSKFANIDQSSGSMGVVNFSGQMSLQSIEKRRPALVLNGTNSVQFTGYISRVSQLIGPGGPAILCCQSTSNLKINATIESYSELLSIKTSLHNASIDFVSANISDGNKPIINLTNASLINGLLLKVHLPVQSEQKERYLLYHALVNEGNEPAKTKLTNSDIYCSDLIDNRYIVTSNIIKHAENVNFNTNEPFSKKGGEVQQEFVQKVSCGKVGSIKPATAIRFNQCDRKIIGNNNAGFYSIDVEGVIRAGDYNSGGTCTQRFTATITVSQSKNGNLDAPAYTVTLLGKSQITPKYIDITNVRVAVDFSKGYGSVQIIPTVTGTGVNEPVTYQGRVKVITDFLVNDTTIFK